MEMHALEEGLKEAQTALDQLRLIERRGGVVTALEWACAWGDVARWESARQTYVATRQQAKAESFILRCLKLADRVEMRGADALAELLEQEGAKLRKHVYLDKKKVIECREVEIDGIEFEMTSESRPATEEELAAEAAEEEKFRQQKEAMEAAKQGGAA